MKTQTKLKSILSLFSALMLVSLFVATAWATVSYVKPQDVTYEVKEAKKSDIPTEFSAESKSRAPEPSTLALFGSGFIGMIISFVRRTYALAKRSFDVAVSVVAILLLSPILLIVALLVKLTSRGPVIYSQTRVGQDGELFTIYKFRTMRTDAEKETGPVWAKANDNRLTPIGNFLRKSHLDELPQFANVLSGEMSLIGPRPERPLFVDEFKKTVPGYESRLAVKPGITGLAQVWHRYDETIDDVKKKIKYDLLYIKNVCLWTDVRIAFRTVRVMLTGEGAR